MAAQYNFKTIGQVPSNKDFIDVVLSKTQRQTPTVVHNGWPIPRIRQFYMRKVKYTASSWHDKLTKILDDFPKVDNIHPFYSDLLNVLYDKDHYKLALGQLSVSRNIISKLSQDYVRLLKYGDSLYRCKQLKRAAMGRMCTLMKKQGPSLAYLEQVRQHMSRLPSIDPNTRTLLVCGYPNVGKSSFMNKVTRADVEVQPYAFTTKSLYVGHMDYKYLRWQVIDTPGILDRPLEERNTIEMQSVTALAHLRAAVLYVVDISEACGYTIKQQAALFHSIKALFVNKPVLVVVNKIDTVQFAALSAEDRALVEEMASEAHRVAHGIHGNQDIDMADEEKTLLSMSTLTEEGVMDVKQVACDRLLTSRVERKLRGKKMPDVLNRMHVAMPSARDTVARPACIPPGVEEARKRREAGERKKLQKDFQEEAGGGGVYSMDMRQQYQLKDEAWKYDIMPEIMDGHNVADFVDPDIDARLEALEREEEAAVLGAIRKKKKKMVDLHRLKKSTAGNKSVLPRTADRERKSTTGNMSKALAEVGLDAGAAVGRARERSMSRMGRKRTRSSSAKGTAAVDGDFEGEKKRVHSSKARSMSRGRSVSMAEPGEGKGLKDAAMRNKALKMSDVARRQANKAAKKGEGDRVILNPKPKHLFSGKRGKGKTDWR